MGGDGPIYVRHKSHVGGTSLCVPSARDLSLPKPHGAVTLSTGVAQKTKFVSSKDSIHTKSSFCHVPMQRNSDRPFPQRQCSFLPEAENLSDFPGEIKWFIFCLPNEVNVPRMTAGHTSFVPKKPACCEPGKGFGRLMVEHMTKYHPFSGGFILGSADVFCGRSLLTCRKTVPDRHCKQQKDEKSLRFHSNAKASQVVFFFRERILKYQTAPTIPNRWPLNTMTFHRKDNFEFTSWFASFQAKYANFNTIFIGWSKNTRFCSTRPSSPQFLHHNVKRLLGKKSLRKKNTR